MAAKKGKTTKQYRQAKKAAKPAAKEAFPGKVKAGRKDMLSKVSSEDREILKELRKPYIETPTGEKVYVKADETAKERIARERKAAMERFRNPVVTEERQAQIEKRMAEKSSAAKAKQAADRAAARAKATKPNNSLLNMASAEKKQTAKAPAKETASDKTKVFKPRSTKPSAKEKPMPKKPGKNFAKYGTLDEYAIEKNLEREAKAGKKSVVKKSVPVKKAAVVKKSAPAPAKPATAQAKPAAKKFSAGTTAKPKPGLLQDIKKNLPKSPTAEAPAVMPKQSTAQTPKNIQASPEAKAKTVAPEKRLTLADLKKNEAAKLKETRAKLASQGKPVAPMQKKAAAKPAAAQPAAKKAAVKAPKKTSGLGKIGKFAGKAVKYGAIGSEVGSIVKGSTEKDWKEIQRLENKLAAAKGQKPRYTNMGSNKNPIQAMTADASHMASLLTLGLVGKTRRQRMDQLNRAIAKAGKKPTASKPEAGKTSYVATSATGKKYLSPSHMSSNKKNINISGGATTKYTVKKGDTLSGIAKNAGLSLSEVRALNPDLMKNPKYKKGSMIWSGTKVNIKKK